MRIRPVATVLWLLLVLAAQARADALPSWQDGPVKTTILAWLDDITRPDGPDHIPPAERIAVFDNDGTFVCERPHGGSAAFQKDMLRNLVAAGRVDGAAMPYRAWLDDDRAALSEYGWRNAYAAMNAAFAGMTTAAYRDSARAWIDGHRHERFGVTVRDLYYGPMLELKDLLLANGFAVWIVTGSTQDFARSFAPEVVGIPVGQVIGTWTDPEYREIDGVAVLLRGAVQHDNGYENKPGAIETRIGRRPVFAAGNSNNDEPMLRWALTGDRRALGLWIRHDDAEREYDYDRGTDRIAGLVAGHPGAIAVSMRDDWRTVFPFGPR